MATETRSASSGRIHIVLVPGFAGFDVLGQLDYYADLTPLFRQWIAGAANGAHPVLHYFDNLPTAGVATRAARLRKYLTKRIARGEFQRGDRLALVGHSTGGLDIRQLVWGLTQRPEEEFPVDGAVGSASPVRARDLLDMLQRIVFLSVPQWGTNIANWVSSHRVARRALIEFLWQAVGASQTPLADRLERGTAGLAAAVGRSNLPVEVRRALTQLAAEASQWGTSLAEWMTTRGPVRRALIADLRSSITRRQAPVADLLGGPVRSDLILAIRDAVNELNVAATDDPERTAEAHEAASEVELWFRHMAWDFAAIDDLAAAPKPGGETPARFDLEARQREIQSWKYFKIETRSYATLGRRPFKFQHARRAPEWKLLRSSHSAGPELNPDAWANTDAIYRMCYRACAGGPFATPNGDGTASATLLDSSEREEIEVWDNDGIVNTASMLWPDGPATRLVRADHGDIIGHYRRVEAVQPSARQFHTYDLLRSSSGFGEPEFKKVWTEVFEFCAG